MSLLGQIICYPEKPQHVKYANGWGFSPLCGAKWWAGAVLIWYTKRPPLLQQNVKTRNAFWTRQAYFYSTYKYIICMLYIWPYIIDLYVLTFADIFPRNARTWKQMCVFDLLHFDIAWSLQCLSMHSCFYICLTDMSLRIAVSYIDSNKMYMPSRSTLQCQTKGRCFDCESNYVNICECECALALWVPCMEIAMQYFCQLWPADSLLAVQHLTTTCGTINMHNLHTHTYIYIYHPVI